jgi:hypothetical protein
MGGQWRGNHGRIFLGVPNSVGGENKERKKERKEEEKGRKLCNAAVFFTVVASLTNSTRG